MDQDTTIVGIVAAFKNVKRDDSYTLHEAQLTDQGMGREISAKEFADAKRLDPHQDWRDIPGAAIDECDAALSHLSPEGWRFYIPAYMIRAIEQLHQPVWKTSLPGSVVYHLTYPTKKEVPLQFYVLDRFKLLDEMQAKAVSSFLNYVAMFAPEADGIRKEAQVALSRYWALPPAQRPNLSLGKDYRP